jgi:hypothetical protein
MKKLTLFVAVVAGLVLVQTTAAQSDRELAIKAARAVEISPLDKETIKLSEKAERWVGETKDVTVGLCGGVVGQFADKKYKYLNELLTAYDLGMAAFKLENPAKASDEKAAQLAGVESVLKTYESILKEKRAATNKRTDELLAKRNSGELRTLIDSIDCSKRPA